MQLDTPKRLTVADYANAHLIHFKSLVCYILDPAQSPAFTGEYSPVKICDELLKVLKAHKHFDTFCKLDPRPDGNYLWIKQNYDTEYAHWAAKQAANNANRQEMLAENERQAKAFQNYLAWQRSRGVRTSTQSLFDMLMEMIKDYNENGADTPYEKILKKIGYLT